MQYTLKTSKGRVNLRFSMYFLQRICELSGHDLMTVPAYMAGDFDPSGNGMVTGGMIGDLKVRANVVAAALEAERFANGDYSTVNPISKEVYDVMESVEGGVLSPQWGDVFRVMYESLTAMLPKEPKEPNEPKKKEVVKSRSRSTIVKTSRSGK
jgi:hypothetical protein